MLDGLTAPVVIALVQCWVSAITILKNVSLLLDERFIAIAFFSSTREL
ncbi:hypothetical protein NDI37_01400 [Funiculus sociatus GB2-A5]|uniref:ATP synthase F0 subunit 8 n=1 Tax=Funiculus sociatus GB2-A5 TaxID=2933946 RepID=A0ABV0JKB5_9CYAN|nr:MULTISPECIES: hypothetical protein [Cyanophyceae]MBD1922577.1 hypothetical protein [Microcoleus sp. FACHB-831]MBD2065644.1 hypothetical protein [Trichocoleus sp. FACHB-6]